MRRADSSVRRGRRDARNHHVPPSVRPIDARAARVRGVRFVPGLIRPASRVRSDTVPDVRSRTPTLWIALGIVYVVWGSTYLAIRGAVRTLAPFLMASIRFLLAGGILYVFAIGRGDREGDRP